MPILTCFIILLQLILNVELNACTGIKLSSKDGLFVHGRTLEFGIEVDTSVTFVPKGYEFVATTDKGSGLIYQSKYAALGITAFDIPAIMDGINEKGLAVGTFYFPGFAEYSKVTNENQTKALSPVDFSNWILTQFSTVEEVIKALPSVVIVETVIKPWGNSPPPFHYVVYDKAGNCLVIEPIKGTLVRYENVLGTITNSPTFDWHLTNLRNFVNLTSFNAKPISVDGLIFAPFGEGSGMVGIPGDFTPPSRLVRAAIYTIASLPVKTTKENINRAFHLLNQFDIPLGAVRSKEGNTTYSDSTLFTCVRDPHNLKYYFKTYNDQTIKVADFKKFDATGKNILSFPTTGDPSYVDISSSLKITHF